jgi:hypothetical protein
MIEFISMQKHGTIVIEQACAEQIIKNIIKQTYNSPVRNIEIDYVGSDIIIEITLKATELNKSITFVNRNCLTIKNQIIKSLHIDNLNFSITLTK